MLFVGSFIDVVHVQCYYPTVNETNYFIESVHQICSCLIYYVFLVPAQLDVFKKALLLGAVFLIDFNYFERNRNQ